MATEAQEFNGRFSPDGKWLAYLAAAAGRTELYVRPFPSGSGRWQVSTGGATEPHWSADGSELFFRKAGTLYRVAVGNTDSGGAFVASSPERVASGFRPGDNLRTYSPAPDGRRFAALPGYETGEATVQINLALHWDREVRRLLKLEPLTRTRAAAGSEAEGEAQRLVELAVALLGGGNSWPIPG